MSTQNTVTQSEGTTSANTFPAGYTSAVSRETLVVGRRLRHELVPGEVGVIVKVRPTYALGGQEQVSYDVVWGNGEWREKLAASLLLGKSSELLSGLATEAEITRLRGIYLDAKLKRRLQDASSSTAMPAAASRSSSAPSAWGATPSWGRRASTAVGALQPREAAMQIRVLLAQHYPETDFCIRVKGDVVKLSWTDGPMSVSEYTDPFISGSGSARKEQAARIRLDRVLSDDLLECAIEFVRRAFERREPYMHGRHPALDAERYRNGSLRDIYPRGSNFDSVSYGALTRLVVMRWDDAAGSFIESQAARAMLVEHEVLFGTMSMAAASEHMRAIREELIEASHEGHAISRERMS